MRPSSPAMLVVASNVDAADEADFNRWYDREHLEERVRLPGFISAARYLSEQAEHRYLGLYRAESLDCFSSDAYQDAFRHQTEWSQTNLRRMRQPMRRVCRVLAEEGQGSGRYLLMLPLSIMARADELAAQARAFGQAHIQSSGFVRSCLLWPDAKLSQPLPNESLSNRLLRPLLLMECSYEAARRRALELACLLLDGKEQDAARYDLKWKLFAEELKR